MALPRSTGRLARVSHVTSPTMPPAVVDAATDR